MHKDEELYKLQKALKAFWKAHGGGVAVNAKHTYVTVEPKYIVGNRINPEIAKKIIGVYLSQLTSDKVVNEEIHINKDSVKIYEKGELVLEIVNSKMVDSISNKMTSEIGKALSKKERKGGGAYLESKTTETYSFGEIKDALAQFLVESEKHDSKSMLKDAILLLVK